MANDLGISKSPERAHLWLRSAFFGVLVGLVGTVLGRLLLAALVVR